MITPTVFKKWRKKHQLGFKTWEVAKIRPIELKINGSFLDMLPLYATIGLTAEMTEIFEGRRSKKF